MPDDGMICPNCDEDTVLRYRSAVSYEPHGERFEDHWCECSKCGGKLTEREVAAMGLIG